MLGITVLTAPADGAEFFTALVIAKAPTTPGTGSEARVTQRLTRTAQSATLGSFFIAVLMVAASTLTISDHLGPSILAWI